MAFLLRDLHNPSEKATLSEFSSIVDGICVLGKVLNKRSARLAPMGPLKRFQVLSGLERTSRTFSRRET